MSLKDFPTFAGLQRGDVTECKEKEAADTVMKN